MDLSTLHGPNYLVISTKARQEFLCAIQEAMNMEFSNPVERRYVTQISASPLPISLSQTCYCSFSFLGFQITILNSPAQFLSHTFFSSCNLSLSVVSRACVLTVVWPWVWVLLFLWVCGHVCM